MISALLFAAAAAAASPQFVLEEHPTLRFSEKTFILGRMRWDYEHRGPSSSLPEGKEDWGFVRRRFSVEGNIGGKLAFEIETDLTGDERWKDVYVEYTPSDALRVRAGKFVVPLGFERTTSIDILDFAYRSMISTHLVPPRDRGVLVFGRLFGGTLSYDGGLFEDGGGTFAGRLAGRGFGRGLLKNLEVGAAMMYGGHGDDVAAVRGTAALGVTFFRGERYDEGHRRRVSAHAAYRSGPAAIKAEYMALADREAQRAAMDASGWYVSGSLVLTGEPEPDSHHPRTPVTRGGIGSIKLAARTERLGFEQSAARTRARAHTAGVTWQPHRFMRLQWNLIRDTLPARRMWTRVLRFHLTI